MLLVLSSQEHFELALRPDTFRVRVKCVPKGGKGSLEGLEAFKCNKAQALLINHILSTCWRGSKTREIRHRCETTMYR